jgi:hypothetical protein
VRENERVSTRKGGIFFDGYSTLGRPGGSSKKSKKIFKKNSSTQLLRQARAQT